MASRTPSSISSPTLSLLAASRRFTTTAQRPYKQPASARALEPPLPSPTAHQPHIPPYPQGPRLFYKQSNTGLYGAARIRFGNRVSGRNEIKTRRKWRPNVHSRRLWSAALQAHVRTRVTTRVLRTVDKLGGLDEYLLGEKPARIAELGPWGWKLRWRIMQTDAVRERFRLQRLALGLPAEGGSLAAEESQLPSGTVEGMTTQELMDETQKMIDEEREFDLAPHEPEQEFMTEERPKSA
jgi:large subunit ribosomal protein L28